MEPPSGRWGAAIIGHECDLQAWADDLKQPFEPHLRTVQMPGATVATVLVGGELRHCASSEQAYAVAVPLVRRLSALIAAHRNSDPVGFDGVIEFLPDGTFRHHKFAAVTIKARLRMRVSATATGGSIPQPKPSYAQTALPAANPLLLDALEYFDRADNWQDLYKSFEALRSLVGDITQLGFSRNAVTQFRRTANTYRHGGSKKSPPPTPMEWKEAKRMVAGIIKSVTAS